MRVLVTGASGMLGRETALALARRGDDVVVLQRRPSGVTGVQEVLGDVTDPEAVGRAAAGCSAVVHLAANVDVVGPEREFERVNVLGTLTVLAAARAAGVARVVHVSSPSVAHTGAALVGVGASPADPARARSPYARTKARAELAALAASGPGFGVVAVRPHLVWGPGDTQLVGRVVERARAGRLVLVGSGAALVDTTYVDDAVDALVAALDAEVAGEALVVTSGQPLPVAEVLGRMCAAAGVPGPRRHVPVPVARAAGLAAEGVWALLRRTDVPPLTRFLVEQLATAHWFDQRRTREVLGWAPLVGVEEGFRRLAAARAGPAAGA